MERHSLHCVPLSVPLHTNTPNYVPLRLAMELDTHIFVSLRFDVQFGTALCVIVCNLLHCVSLTLCCTVKYGTLCGIMFCYKLRYCTLVP